MSPALRSLLRSLAGRTVALAAWLALHALLAHWLGGWDAGQHLLAGGPGAGRAIGVLLSFFAFHLVTYFVVPPLVAVSCVQAVARYLEARGGGLG